MSAEQLMAEYYAKEVAVGDESARFYLRLAVHTWRRNHPYEFTRAMDRLQKRAGAAG